MTKISRLTGSAVLAGALTLAGWTLGAGAAQAEGPSYQGGNCPQGLTCTHWCPGDPAIPGSQVLSWDWNVCHDWFWNSYGIVDVNSSTLYPWRGAPLQVVLR
ncbi:hypothetical protein EV580_3180 [Mycobacterium sp. BK086]|uniref:hypothetical protein n=1 Tax=Mycobacterium sp. BK086 TaxID=2512165 RepID=UPI0010E42598|nr:hypothetical protein [Mycobacterium sp. BK086]TDO15039.1 hypothetical protein EV580_3180 [Mycobacterium sp. BK086]